VIEKNRLAGPKDDMLAVIAEVREALDVDVTANTTVALQDPEDRPRSAYVRISFESTSPDEAMAVAKDLVQLVVEARGGQRRAEAESELRRLDVAIEQSRLVVEGLRQQIVTLRASPDPEDPVVRFRLSLLPNQIRDAEQRLVNLENGRSETRTRLRAAAEGQTAEFSVTAPEIRDKPMPRVKKLTIVGIVTLLLSIPVCVLLVGAFDPTVFSPDDVRRLGIRCVGHVRGTRRKPA
jgi:hypothetical protein